MTLNRLAHRLSRWSFLFIFCLLAAKVGGQNFDSDPADASTYRILSAVGGGNTKLGSGFLVNSSGYIVTNYHVIDGAHDIYVLQRHDDTIKVWVSNLHSKHANLDLAILRVKDIVGTPVTFTDTLPKKGYDVFAVGFPGQADEEEEQRRFFRALSRNDFKDIPADPSYNNFVSTTVRGGTIESIRRLPWGNNDQMAMVITHSANITGGNSGGPLFLRNGDFIGVNTMIVGEGRSEKGVLVGNVMRRSSLYTELATVLNRLEIPFQTRGEEKTQSDKEPSPSPGSSSSPPSPLPETKAPNSKPDTDKSIEKSDASFLEENGGYLAIGLGAVVACLALFFGLKKPKTPQTEPSPQNSPPSAVAPPPQLLRSDKVSVPITPAVHQSIPSGPPKSGWTCHLRSTPESPVQVNLTIADGEVPLTGFILGRDSSALGRIPHASVSRKHAKVKVTDKSLYVSDAGSSNGTIVRGEKLKPKTGMILQNGDIIKLGEVSLTVSLSKSTN